MNRQTTRQRNDVCGVQYTIRTTLRTLQNTVQELSGYPAIYVSRELESVIPVCQESNAHLDVLVVLFGCTSCGRVVRFRLIKSARQCARHKQKMPVHNLIQVEGPMYSQAQCMRTSEEKRPI